MIGGENPEFAGDMQRQRQEFSSTLFLAIVTCEDSKIENSRKNRHFYLVEGDVQATPDNKVLIGILFKLNVHLPSDHPNEISNTGC